MIRLGPVLLIGGAILAILFFLFVPRWRLPGPGTQLGPNASSMVQFAPTADEADAQSPRPPVLPPVADDSRPATTAFHNVTVLTDLNAGDFMRLQNAMTAWVSPRQGCGFCHVDGDYASDARPAKQAARIMLGMTRHINADWRGHVGAAGVTCFSCHRGQPVPSEVWYQSPPERGQAMVDRQEDYQEWARTVRNFFPNEGYEEYLLQDTQALGQSHTALPTGHASAQIVLKRLYESMMQMSDGIGVNCGYCHNSRAFFDWRQSTPARWVGYSGITLTRDINRNYLLKLMGTLPQSRAVVGDTRTMSLPARDRWPQDGNGLADCATCHHGAPKPSAGAGLLAQVPALAGPGPSGPSPSGPSPSGPSPSGPSPSRAGARVAAAGSPPPQP
jgi:photosynthetic reaction center cytochrome c subunit